MVVAVEFVARCAALCRHRVADEGGGAGPMVPGWEGSLRGSENSLKDAFSVPVGRNPRGIVGSKLLLLDERYESSATW